MCVLSVSETVDLYNINEQESLCNKVWGINAYMPGRSKLKVASFPGSFFSNRADVIKRAWYLIAWVIVRMCAHLPRIWGNSNLQYILFLYYRILLRLLYP